MVKPNVVESPKVGFDIVCGDYYLDHLGDTWYNFRDNYQSEPGVFKTKEKAQEILKTAPEFTKKNIVKD